MVVGCCLSKTGDAEKSIDYALGSARGQWILRKKALCRKRVPLSKRLESYYSSVGASALNELEGVPLTQAVLRKVMTLDRSCL